MMKKITAILLAMVMLCSLTGVYAESADDGIAELNEIFASYEGKEIVLSDELQIVHNQVNFRKAPCGKVLGRLQGGDFLKFLSETQYKDALWYHAYSEEYGEGYVLAVYAKPVWNGQNDWEAMEKGKNISDNLLLYDYWMGTYQMDHGLSIIETIDGGRYVHVAPITVRGNDAMILEDMGIQMVTKMYEYGLICYQPCYRQLQDPSVSLKEKEKIASSVLKNHYDTDSIWKIIAVPSILFFVHSNDLHGEPNGDYSKRDYRLIDAVWQKVVEEH